MSLKKTRGVPKGVREQYADGKPKGGKQPPCPQCGGKVGTVIDSRPCGDGIRRRRVCLTSWCLRRFTTYEGVI